MPIWPYCPSVEHQSVCLPSVIGAEAAGRLGVERLINASPGFHWHFTGSRRRFASLICFSSHFPFSHCLFVTLPAFLPTPKYLKIANLCTQFSLQKVCPLHTFYRAGYLCPCRSGVSYFLPRQWVGLTYLSIYRTDWSCCLSLREGQLTAKSRGKDREKDGPHPKRLTGHRPAPGGQAHVCVCLRVCDGDRGRGSSIT